MIKSVMNFYQDVKEKKVEIYFTAEHNRLYGEKSQTILFLTIYDFAGKSIPVTGIK